MLSPALPALRPATAADESFLFRLFASTRSEEMAAAGWSEARCRDFLRSQYAARAHSYRADFPDAVQSIVVEGRTPVGALIVHRTPGEIRLVDLAFLPERRGAGAGTKLVRGLMDEARTSGRPLRLHARKGSRAEQWYLRLGFAPTGLNGHYLALAWWG